jgi:hypothetical protein
VKNEDSNKFVKLAVSKMKNAAQILLEASRAMETANRIMTDRSDTADMTTFRSLMRDGNTAIKQIMREADDLYGDFGD